MRISGWNKWIKAAEPQGPLAMACRRNYLPQCTEPDNATDRYRLIRLCRFPLF